VRRSSTRQRGWIRRLLVVIQVDFNDGRRNFPRRVEGICARWPGSFLPWSFRRDERRAERKGTTLSAFGGDEDHGVGGPNGFTAERGGSNGTAAAVPAARSMSFMRSQKQTAASLVPLQANGASWHKEPTCYGKVWQSKYGWRRWTLADRQEVLGQNLTHRQLPPKACLGSRKKRGAIGAALFERPFPL
jgi:hypothetical protein